MKIGDKVKWIDPQSGMGKTGIITEIQKVVSQSNDIKNLDDPYEPLVWKDVDLKSYDIKCDQRGAYVISEDEIEKFKLEVIKAN